ncbi:MAG: 3'-5' exonuclease [Spirochaetota bacterium]
MENKYTHAIILDFEATCDEEQKPEPQEIIEFPSVLLSLVDGKVIDTFESFVQPQHHPILSDFCKQLTSIRQSDVEQAESFPKVLEKHMAWLDGHSLTQHNALFVTCGDWDLQQAFPRQCAASKPIIEFLPPIYRQWQNIKRAFCKVEKIEKAPGMAGMLQAFSLPLQGHHHRGIDDCRNLANLYKKLLQKGAKTEITATIHLKKYPPIRLRLKHKEVVQQVILQHRNIETLRALAQKAFKQKVKRLSKNNGSVLQAEDFINLQPLEEIIVN